MGYGTAFEQTREIQWARCMCSFRATLACILSTSPFMSGNSLLSTTGEMVTPAGAQRPRSAQSLTWRAGTAWRFLPSGFKRWYMAVFSPPMENGASTCCRSAAARGSTLGSRPWLLPGGPLAGGQAAHPSSIPTWLKPKSFREVPAGFPLIGRDVSMRPSAAASSTSYMRSEQVFISRVMRDDRTIPLRHRT